MLKYKAVGIQLIYILNKSENVTHELFAIYIYKIMQTKKLRQMKAYLNVKILGNAKQ